jgi:hypothetical protein
MKLPPNLLDQLVFSTADESLFSHLSKGKDRLRLDAEAVNTVTNRQRVIASIQVSLGASRPDGPIRNRFQQGMQPDPQDCQ